MKPQENTDSRGRLFEEILAWWNFSRAEPLLEHKGSAGQALFTSLEILRYAIEDP